MSWRAEGLFVGAPQRRAARDLVGALAFGQVAQNLCTQPLDSGVFDDRVLRRHRTISIAGP